MIRRRDFQRLSRGLRFRLTASYAVFFTVLLVGVAFLIRFQLGQTLLLEQKDALSDQWAAMKGYLRIEPEKVAGSELRAYWYYDPKDDDERTIVDDIKKIYMVADASGKIIHDLQDKPAWTEYYKDVFDSPQTIRARVAKAAVRPEPFWDPRIDFIGERYLIRSGVVWAEGHVAPFYVSLGMPLSQYQNVLRRFTWIFVFVIPGGLIMGAILGWFMAGRVLTPVKDVALAAQRISGSNLSLRIPTREAGDELDYLILTFNRMIERLESSFQQMKQFSGDVSHELRTPITAIRGQLEVALFTAQTTDQYREAMFNALTDIDRLSQIVRALLLLSQAESGQLVLQKTRMNLSEVTEDLVDQFQIPAEAAGVHLTVKTEPDCLADVDRVQIERMVTNLLSNAMKFTPEGGGVHLHVGCAGGKVKIVVADTGCGIATEYLPHIFNRFYRVPGSGSAPGPEQGLGLGLSFVAWIVKAHNGTIKVDSTPGKGTTFTIELPAAEKVVELEMQPLGSD